MLHKGLREGQTRLQAVIHKPNECLAEVRVGLGLRITFGDRMQVVIDRKEAPGLSVTLDAMRDSLQDQGQSHARERVLFGHCQVTVAVSRMARKARGDGPG